MKKEYVIDIDQLSTKTSRFEIALDINKLQKCLNEKMNWKINILGQGP